MSLLRFIALGLVEAGVLVVLAVAGWLAGQAIGAAAARRATRNRVRCEREGLR